MKQSVQRTWGGRFAASPAAALKAFSESVSFDWRLYPHDIAGSIAHAKGLARIGVLTAGEASKIERGLKSIEREIEAGKFSWNANPAKNCTRPEVATTKLPPTCVSGCGTRFGGPSNCSAD
jgi:hypothetical protein